MKPILFSAVLLLVLSSSPVAAKNRIDNANTAQPQLSEYALDFYTNRLAARLFRQLPAGTLTQQALPQLSVASFLPVNSLDLSDADADERALANQLADSMLSHAAAYGLNAYDYRLRSEVLLLSEYEQALSRKTADVGAAPLVNTILSGSYTVQEDGYIINARIMDIRSKQVLAAVTDYVPLNVFWSEQQVIKRGDYLYRNSRGEQK